MKRPLSFITLLVLTVLTATAGPRTRQQALQLAQEQAAKSGATVSANDQRKAKSPQPPRPQNPTTYSTTPTAPAIPSFRPTTSCPPSWAMPQRELWTRPR